MHANSCCHPRRRAPGGSTNDQCDPKGIVSVLKLVKVADIAAESQISSVELVAVIEFHTFHSQMHLSLSLSLSRSISLPLSLFLSLAPSFSPFLSLSLSLSPLSDQDTCHFHGM